MRFHQYVKPHHHLTIWMMAVFQVVLALGVYADATLLYAQEYTQEQSDEGPNEETQEFFGGKVKKTTGSLPAACQQFENRSSAPASANPQSTESTAITTESAPITPQASQSYPSSSPYSSTEPSAYQSSYSTSPSSSPDSLPPSTMTEDDYNRLSDEDKRRYREKSADGSSASPSNFSSYPSTTRPSYDGSSQPSTFTISADCQKAMITQIRSEMSEFRDKMKNGGFTAKLDTILAVIDKLENGVDGQKSGLSLLKAQGIETSAIQALFGPIREDTQTLKEFFVEMLAAMDAFFAIDDPEEAFTYMRTQFPQSKPASMGTTANRLVTNIKDLVSKLKAMSEQLETTTGGSDAD